MNEDTLWKTMFAIAIFAISSTIYLQIAFAEEYYYLPDWEVYGIIEQQTPLVCAFDFDHSFSNEVLAITERSLVNWQQAFADYAKQPDKWEMDFKIIPVELQSFEEEQDDCTIILYYLPEPDIRIWNEVGLEGVYDTLAITDNLGPVADIYIVYRDIVYDNDKSTEWHYEDVIPYDLEETLDHELGHAFSLDHPTDLTQSNFKEQNEGMLSYSTMVTPSDVAEELVPFDTEMFFEITEYDIRSLENLYGENGFDKEIEIELNLFQQTVKDSMELYPQWFPEKYILYLKGVGLVV